MKTKSVRREKGKSSKAFKSWPREHGGSSELKNEFVFQSASV